MSIRLTPAVKVLAILFFVLFLVQHSVDQFLGGNVLGVLGLSPAGFFGAYRFWQLLTYGVLHGDVMHLFLNLMMLVFMGGELEGRWGTAQFLRFYLLCTVMAGVSYLGLSGLLGRGLTPVPMIGASGAIYGLLMAYGLIFGERVLLFMMVFPMKAKIFIWILVVLELMTTVFSPGSGLSSVSHLGGMITGFLLLWGGAAFRVWKKSLASGVGGSKRAASRTQHLKLVINNDKQVELRPSDPGKNGDDSKPPTFH